MRPLLSTCVMVLVPHNKNHSEQGTNTITHVESNGLIISQHTECSKREPNSKPQKENHAESTERHQLLSATSTDKYFDETIRVPGDMSNKSNPTAYCVENKYDGITNVNQSLHIHVPSQVLPHWFCYANCQIIIFPNTSSSPSRFHELENPVIDFKHELEGQQIQHLLQILCTVHQGIISRAQSHHIHKTSDHGEPPWILLDHQKPNSLFIWPFEGVRKPFEPRPKYHPSCNRGHLCLPPRNDDSHDHEGDKEQHGHFLSFGNPQHEFSNVRRSRSSREHKVR